MGKVKQKNWLLLITFCLLIASVVLFFVNNRKNLGLGECSYEGVEYLEGERILNYEGRNDCYCSKGGKILCESEQAGMTYESFSSSSLSFSYSFINYLEKSNPDLNKISLQDIDQKDGSIKFTLHREALCGENELAPAQVGMYKGEDDSLIFTTITNRDESLYSRVCVISNDFQISNFSIGDVENFTLLYQGESGQIYDLNACFVKGKLYTKGEVFRDSEKQELCTCEGSNISCEQL